MPEFNVLKNLKIGFIGAGNMGQAMLQGLIDGGMDRQKLFVTTRTEKKLKYLEEKFGIGTFKNNEEVVDHCDIIILAVKPQDVFEVIEPISKSFDPSKIVISIAAGIPIEKLKLWLGNVEKIVRLMPNTPVNIGKGVVGFCTSEKAEHLSDDIIGLFSPLGEVIETEEGESFEALTVGSGSGVGFVFEIMIYWREWLEGHGFDTETARKIVVQTFLGASELARSKPNTLIDELQRKVVSKKGVTHAGLESMRDMELERVLRFSFEKAVLRDRELGEG